MRADGLAERRSPGVSASRALPSTCRGSRGGFPFYLSQWGRGAFRWYFPAGPSFGMLTRPCLMESPRGEMRDGRGGLAHHAQVIVSKGIKHRKPANLCQLITPQARPIPRVTGDCDE